MDERKLTPQVTAYLAENGVSLYKYNKVEDELRTYSEYNILLDGDETSYRLWKAVKCQEIVSSASPIPVMKAVKNETEVKGFRRAMLRDGIAMVKFLRWLKPAVEMGGQTEMSVDRKLTSLRSEQPLFVIFPSIPLPVIRNMVPSFIMKPQRRRMLSFVLKG